MPRTSKTFAYAITEGRLRLDIAILDISALRPHEEVIPELRDYLVRSIKADRCVKNPVIVDERSLVVLDGVHRVAALQKLGIRRIPVCLVDYRNPAIRVLSWYRTVRGSLDPDQVVLQIKKVGYTVEKTENSSVKDVGHSPMAAALQLREQTFLIKSSFKDLQEAFAIISRIESRLKAAGLTVRYETESDALDGLEKGWVDAVICTPKISKEEIIQYALKNQALAWKATRHVIPARPLNVNVPLALLTRDEKSLAQLNKELKHLLTGRQLTRLPPGSVVSGRRYDEELYVFEE